jgi:dihydropteroate synthase
MAEAAGFSWRGLLAARRNDRPLIAGIVNATPDSFSDGTGSVDPAERVAFALRLLDEGADLLDIGAESTRPGAMEVDPVEEWRRLEPVLTGILSARHDTVISVDTRHASTAEKALQAGAKIINDVSGLVFDAAMKELVAKSRCGVIINHATTTPELMQQSSYIIDDNADFVLTIYQAVIEVQRTIASTDATVINSDLPNAAKKPDEVRPLI